MSKPDDLIELGRVLGAHGIQGWIKIQPFSSDATAFGSTKLWWLSAPADPLSRDWHDVVQPVAMSVVWAKRHGATWLARIKDLTDRDSAEALKGKLISVSRADFPALDEDEYYWVDLIGCTVTTDEDGEISHLGIVESIQDSPAHPILMVRQQCEERDGVCLDRLDDKQKPIYSLIPFVAAHVLGVDTATRVIKTNWPRDF